MGDDDDDDDDSLIFSIDVIERVLELRTVLGGCDIADDATVTSPSLLSVLLLFR